MERKIRTIVLEDGQSIRQILESLLKDRGHEVLTYQDPTLCPLQQSHDCRCAENERCADIIITDLDMPNVSGLDFLAGQVSKGCRIQYIAIMSGAWPELSKQRAKDLGYSVFDKPFSLAVLTEWLDKCEERIDQSKDLSDWFLQEE
jgi:DNA-binding NtrC family response regulator